MTVFIYCKNKPNEGYFSVNNVAAIEMQDESFFKLTLENGEEDIYKKEDYEISSIHDIRWSK